MGEKNRDMRREETIYERWTGNWTLNVNGKLMGERKRNEQEARGQYLIDKYLTATFRRKTLLNVIYSKVEKICAGSWRVDLTLSNNIFLFIVFIQRIKPTNQLLSMIGTWYFIHLDMNLGQENSTGEEALAHPTKHHKQKGWEYVLSSWGSRRWITHAEKKNPLQKPSPSIHFFSFYSPVFYFLFTFLITEMLSLFLMTVVVVLASGITHPHTKHAHEYDYSSKVQTNMVWTVECTL